MQLAGVTVQRLARIAYPQYSWTSVLLVGMFLCLAVVLFPPSCKAAPPGPLFGAPEESAENDSFYIHCYGQLWQKVLQAEGEAPAFKASGAGMNAADAGQWRALCKRARKASQPEVLRLVNGFFNHWRSKHDTQAFGTPDYWASPQEFIRNRGGDCEDYAITKYFALKYLGVPAKRMRLVIIRQVNGKGVPHPQLHAVLAVQTPATWFILDNNARPKLSITPHTQYKGRFVPLYSMNELGAWKHLPDPVRAMTSKKQKSTATSRH